MSKKHSVPLRPGFLFEKTKPMLKWAICYKFFEIRRIREKRLILGLLRPVEKTKPIV
jgi:hypothetical protein